MKTILTVGLNRKGGLYQNYMAWLDWQEPGVKDVAYPSLWAVLYGAGRYMLRMTLHDIQNVLTIPVRVKVIDRPER